MNGNGIAMEWVMGIITCYTSQMTMQNFIASTKSVELCSVLSLYVQQGLLLLLFLILRYLIVIVKSAK